MAGAVHFQVLSLLAAERSQIGPLPATFFQVSEQAFGAGKAQGAEQPVLSKAAIKEAATFALAMSRIAFTYERADVMDPVRADLLWRASVRRSTSTAWTMRKKCAVFVKVPDGFSWLSRHRLKRP
jgi:hypothetical protein